MHKDVNSYCLRHMASKLKNEELELTEWDNRLKHTWLECDEMCCARQYFSMMAMGFHWSSTTAITADGRQSQPVPVQIRSHLVNIIDNEVEDR